MARIAGNKGHYTIAMVDHEGNLVPGMTWDFASVTTVLDVISKPSLMHWYYKTGLEGFAFLAAKYGDKLPHDFDSIKSLMSTEKLSPYSKKGTAAKSGTSIHAELEKLCAGKTIKRTEGTAGLLNWWDERGLSPKDILATETPLVSFKHRVAGTPDVLYVDPQTNLRVLADLKTGKHIAWTMFAQGEAYRMMMRETTALDADVVSVLHCRPLDQECGPTGWQELRSPDITVESFLSALQIYRALPVKWHAEDMDDERIV